MTLLYLEIDQFSLEFRKTKTKAITLANHSRRRQSNEPIRPRNKYMSRVPSTRKCMRVSHDYFRFSFCFVNKVAMRNQNNREITFDTKLKTALFSCNASPLL